MVNEKYFSFLNEKLYSLSLTHTYKHTLIPFRRAWNVHFKVYVLICFFSPLFVCVHQNTLGNMFTYTRHMCLYSFKLYHTFQTTVFVSENEYVFQSYWIKTNFFLCFQFNRKYFQRVNWPILFRLVCFITKVFIGFIFTLLCFWTLQKKKKLLKNLFFFIFFSIHNMNLFWSIFLLHSDKVFFLFLFHLLRLSSFHCVCGS